MIPVILAVSLFFLSFGGLFGLMQLIRKQVETQIRLDRCVASVAVRFEDLMDSLEASNRWLTALRATLIPAHLTPPTIAAIRAAIQSVYLSQEIKRLSWLEQQSVWSIRRGCGKNGDIAFPLPGLPVTRPAPDALGPNPLQLKSGILARVKIQVLHRLRGAAAELRRKNGRTQKVSSQSSSSSSIGGWSGVWIPATGSVSP